MGLQNPSVVAGLFGRQVRSQNTVGTGTGSSRCKFLEAHLQNGVVVAEKHQRHLTRLADATDKIKNTGESCAGFEGPLGSPLNRRTVGKGIAERNAEFDYVGAGFGHRKDEFERGVERRIAGREISHNAKFARFAQLCEAF